MKLIIKSKPSSNKKRKQNLCITSSIQVRTKMWKEDTCSFCKQGHKVTNCEKRISIGNEVDPNYLLQFMENSCPCKI